MASDISVKKKIYEGKTKTLYTSGMYPDLLIQHFKDDMTAFNKKKHEIIHGKGIINNYISEFLMSRLACIGIRTHLVKMINMREQLVKKLSIIPIEVVVRNVAAGSIIKRLGLKEGMQFTSPLIEFFHKCDELDDPMITDEHILFKEWLDTFELETIKVLAWRINDFLTGLFSAINIRLVDFKLEFGIEDGELVLADEISPDSCRLWDMSTNKKLDKDRFRLGLEDVLGSYREVARRLGILPKILKSDA